MSQKGYSGKKGKKKKCSRGQDCPYKNEYQHNLEFFHVCDGDIDGTDGNIFVPFSGVGQCASRKPNHSSSFSFSSSRLSQRGMLQKPKKKKINAASLPSTDSRLITNNLLQPRDSTRHSNNSSTSNLKNNKKLKFTKANFNRNVQSKSASGIGNQSDKIEYVDLVDCESPASIKSLESVVVVHDIDNESGTKVIKATTKKFNRETTKKKTKEKNCSNILTAIDLSCNDSDDNENNNETVEVSENQPLSVKWINKSSNNKISNRKLQFRTNKRTASSTINSEYNHTKQRNDMKSVPSILTSHENQKNLLSWVSNNVVHNSVDRLEQRQISLAIAESNRYIKENQDNEYYESLRIDQEKERKRKIVESTQEMLLRKKQKLEEEEKNCIQKRISASRNKLLPEPTEDSKLTVTIGFRLPGACEKTRLVRKFLKNSDVDQLFFFLNSTKDMTKVKRWKLFHVVGGAEIICGEGKTIEDLGLCPRGVVIVKDEDT